MRRVVLWNVLRAPGGAGPLEAAEVCERLRADAMLLQEADERFLLLPRLLGGAALQRNLPGRGHGPASWFAGDTAPAWEEVRLPTPRAEAGPRAALVARTAWATVANVHLSHRPWANRAQLRALAARLRRSTGPGWAALVAGDTNLVGPAWLPGWEEAVPRAATHRAWGVVPLRPDRALVPAGGGLRVASCRALPGLAGRSDHAPVLLELATRRG